MENKKVVICVLMPLLLLTTFMSVFAVESVNATQVAMEWGHLKHVDPEPGEEYWEEVICYQIDNMFTGGWSHQNAYDELTTDENVATVLEYTSSPYEDCTWSTTWWVGDFLHPGPYNPWPYGHFACYGHPDSSNNIWDNSDVYLPATYYGTQPSKQYFTFMWTCANGGRYWTNLNGGWQNISGITWPAPTNPGGTPNNPNLVYGYYDSINNTGAVGMPFAWTARTDMSPDGYIYPVGSHAYIGWENTSPFMKDTPTPGWTSTGLQYIYFAYYFYRYALGWDNGGTHGTIRQSLNYAAVMTFGNQYNFGNSILNVGEWKQNDFGWLYCKMRLLGNGNTVLPY
jgi:hypothetical protein